MVYKQTSHDGVRDSNSNTPPEARHPRNKRTIKRIRILIIIADITIDSWELFGNILANREDMRAIFDCSVCLVTFTKRENKRIIGQKLCNGEVKCIFGRNVGMMIENAFLCVRGHVGNTFPCNVTRASATETYSISSLQISPVK